MSDSLPFVKLDGIKLNPELIEVFEPTKALPVKISEKGMKLVEKFSGVSRTGNTLFLELGTGRVNTPEPILTACDSISVTLIAKALNQDCEYISFFL